MARTCRAARLPSLADSAAGGACGAETIASSDAAGNWTDQQQDGNDRQLKDEPHSEDPLRGSGQVSWGGWGVRVKSGVDVGNGKRKTEAQNLEPVTYRNTVPGHAL